MLARVPWIKPVIAKPRPRQLSRDHRRRLVDGVAAILRKGDPTPFAFEAFCIYGLRSGLCLRGWGWHEADETAQDVVSAALRQIGAKRPTWYQGQPEYTQDGVIMFERTRCVRCHWKLPEGHRKFCSSLCAGAHHESLYRRFKAEEIKTLADAA